METPAIEKRIRWTGALIGAGLIVQSLSLTRVHPLAFIAFLAIGCPLVGAGILVYLMSLVAREK